MASMKSCVTCCKRVQCNVLNQVNLGLRIYSAELIAVKHLYYFQMNEKSSYAKEIFCVKANHSLHLTMNGSDRLNENADSCECQCSVRSLRIKINESPKICIRIRTSNEISKPPLQDSNVECNIRLPTLIYGSKKKKKKRFSVI